MKKIFSFVCCLLVVLTVFVSCSKKNNSRKGINEFLKSYENVVVQAEKAAKSNSLGDLLDAMYKSVEMAEQADKFQDFVEWNEKDTKKYLELTARYSRAMAQNSASSDSVNDFDFDDFSLSDFGFEVDDYDDYDDDDEAPKKNSATDRKDIDQFLKSYEKVVVQAEKAAKSNSVTELLSVVTEITEMAEKADKFQNFNSWTEKDSKKYLELTARYTKAMEKMNDSSGFEFSF